MMYKTDYDRADNYYRLRREGDGAPAGGAAPRGELPRPPAQAVGSCQVFFNNCFPELR